MISSSVAHDVCKDNIAVICVCPGGVQTHMTKWIEDPRILAILLSPEDAVDNLMTHVLGKFKDDMNGKFFNKKGEIIPW